MISRLLCLAYQCPLGGLSRKSGSNTKALGSGRADRVRVPAGKLENEEWVYRASETHGFYCTLESRQALPTIMEIIK